MTRDQLFRFLEILGESFNYNSFTDIKEQIA